LLRRGTCQSAIIEKPRELVHQIDKAGRAESFLQMPPEGVPKAKESQDGPEAVKRRKKSRKSGPRRKKRRESLTLCKTGKG